MQPAGIAAGGIASAGPRFGSKCTTGARTPIIDRTNDIDTKGSLKRYAACWITLAPTHAYATVTDRLGERSRNPAPCAQSSS
jgi:hypothetical protein